jgi:hypothetical protein
LSTNRARLNEAVRTDRVRALRGLSCLGDGGDARACGNADSSRARA